MRAERLGSYSMVATFAGTSSFRRLKSMRRYWRLCPPPWWRVVMRPLLLRPALLGRGSRRDFSGLSAVISAKSETVWKRLPALVGLRCLTAIDSFPSFRWPSCSGSGGTTPDYHGTARILHVRQTAQPPQGPGEVPYSTGAAACWAKISICSPGASVTMAFFQERVLPMVE